MSADRISKYVTGFALSLFVAVAVFNLGRHDVLAKARKCHPEPVMYGGLPFKGGFEQ